MAMTSSLKWNGALVTAREKEGARLGLLKAAEHVLEQATRIVPIAPSGGTLERSGVAGVSDSELKASVSYGSGAAEAYAVVQHEHMEFHHTRPGAQAKYLETPLNAERGKCNEILAIEIRKALAG